MINIIVSYAFVNVKHMLRLLELMSMLDIDHMSRLFMKNFILFYYNNYFLMENELVGI